MKKGFGLKFTSVISVLILSLFGFNLILAALPGDEGLTLSPPLKELTLNPGEKSTQVLKLTNPTNKLVELYAKSMNFSAKGETGEPGFTSAEEGDSKYSLASWIKLTQAKVALTPEQVVEYKYDIEVPQDAEPGGHYGVIFFATTPPDVAADISQVALSSMVGGLVMVKVPGDIKENGRIEDFSSDKLLYLFNKVKLTTRISNLGNVHFKPRGSIVIKNIFGKTTDTLSFNEQGGNVLPESIRKFENNWDSKKILIGPYTATANLVYGESEKAMTEKITFWMIPWWLLVIIAVIILLVIIWVIWRKIKKGKKQKNSTYDEPKIDRPDNQGPKYTQLG
jgi:hypothetical protein